MQATRPQTLAYALTDSPAGQLAWIVEKFHEWTDPAARAARARPSTATSCSPTSACSGSPASGASSAHATYEGMQAWKQMEAAAGDHGARRRGGAPAGPPMGVAVFAADTTIRSVMDPGGTFAHWAEFDRGGHFPAMEVPDLVVADLRAFLHS